MNTATFIRPDGKEKVTGAGRYTADLNSHRPAAREAPLRRPHARAHRPHRHDKGARAPGRARRPHARGRPGCALRGHGQGPPAVREGARAFRGRRRRRRRRADARARCRSGGADRGRLRAAAGDFRHRGGLSRRRAADPRGVGVLRGRRRDGPRRQRARLLHDRQGRRRDGARRGRRRRQGPLPRRRLAGRSDRAARDPRAMAGRPRHRLVVDAGAVRRAERGRARPPDPGVARARDRAAPRRRLRLQVRLSLRGSRRGARARRRPPGQARLHAATRSSSRPITVARGW